MVRHTVPYPPATRRLATPLEPTPGLFLPPTPDRVIGTHRRRLAGLQRPSWFFLGAHGGAGTSTVSRYSHRTDRDERSWGMDAGRSWPDPALEPTANVVIVAATHMAGLSWARDVIRGYVAGLAPPDTNLLGLVLTPDQHGRLPKPLASAVALLRGAYPHVWALPWMPDLRFSAGTSDASLPPTYPDYRTVLDQIRTISEGDPA